MEDEKRFIKEWFKRGSKESGLLNDYIRDDNYIDYVVDNIDIKKYLLDNIVDESDPFYCAENINERVVKFHLLKDKIREFWKEQPMRNFNLVLDCFEDMIWPVNKSDWFVFSEINWIIDNV